MERMMPGVRLPQQKLIRTYGISRRLAVRIGALLAKGVEVTATLIEIAGPGSVLEKLLLHPQMLASAERLDAAMLQDLAAETGADTEGAFVVIESDGKRVIALEEEILAAEARTETAEEQTLPGIVTPARDRGPARLLDQQEIAGLFTAEEIARIKLDALAGRDPETRISAVRKLLYAPLSEREKGAVYVRVLMDPVSRVRGEAVKALESLGFNRDMADAVQGAFDGDPRIRNAALRRIGELLGTLQPAERQVVLAVLVEMFRETSPAGPNDPLLRVLHRAVPIIVGHPEVLPEMTRVCVQHLIAEPVRVGHDLRDLLLKLTAAAAEGEGAREAARPVLDKIWAEVSTVREPAPRALLLSLLMEAEHDEERRRALCAIVVEELVREDQDELTRLKLGHNMVALGMPAAQAIIHRFASVAPSARNVLVPFLDILCLECGLPPDTRNQVARQLLDALKLADRRLRMEILRTRVFHQPDLNPELRETLVRELLPMLRTAEQPDVSERAAILLESLGEVSTAALFEMIRQNPSAPEADAAARVLGSVLAANPDAPSPAKLTRRIFRFLCRRVGSRSNRLGGYAAALAMIAASGLVAPEETQKAFDLVASQLGKARYHTEIVEAIGRLGACAAVTPQQRIRAVHLLGSLVERPSGEEETELREIDTDEGKSFELAGRLDFDSATLPAAVRGLRAIALSGRVSAALRDRITEQLLRVWNEVAEWEIIWGPHSSEELARAVGKIGADEDTGDMLRERVIRSLGRALDRLSVVRALGDVFLTPFVSGATARLVVKTGLEILEQWVEPEIAPEELAAVLTAAARAASRKEVTSRSSLARRLRQRTAELLFDALNAGHSWCLEPLELMRDCPAVPKTLRDDIAARLREMLAVRKL